LSQRTSQRSAITIVVWLLVGSAIGTLTGGTIIHDLSSAAARPNTQIPYPYVTDPASGSVILADPKTGSPLLFLKVNQQLAHIVAPREGRFIYATVFNSSSLLVLDKPSFQVVATVPVGDGAHHLELSPDGSQIFVVGQKDNSVSVVDVRTSSLVRTIGVGADPHAAAFAPDGSLAFVTNKAQDTVSVIDVQEGQVIQTIPVGSSPSMPAVSLRATWPKRETSTSRRNPEKRSAQRGPYAFTCW